VEAIPYQEWGKTEGKEERVSRVESRSGLFDVVLEVLLVEVRRVKGQEERCKTSPVAFRRLLPANHFDSESTLSHIKTHAIYPYNSTITIEQQQEMTRDRQRLIQQVQDQEGSLRR